MLVINNIVVEIMVFIRCVVWMVCTQLIWDTLLSNDNNDNENNNRSMCKTKCPKIIARVNGVYADILIDTGAEFMLM